MGQPMKREARTIFARSLVVLTALLLSACACGYAHGQESPPADIPEVIVTAERVTGIARTTPVSVGVVRRQDVRVMVQAIGTMSARATAVVRAKVSGELVFVHDMRVPGMLHGRVVRPPYAGADHGDFIGNTLESVDQQSIAHIPGIRAALCGCEFQARATRQHNNANVLALGALVTGPGLALEIVDIFLDTPFSEEERHSRRVSQLEEE